MKVTHCVQWKEQMTSQDDDDVDDFDTMKESQALILLTDIIKQLDTRLTSDKKAV